jgi:DNA-directed RNA polymerase specialized sigma24 family protein
MKYLHKVQSQLKGWLFRVMHGVHHDRHRRGGGRRGVTLRDNPFVSLEELPELCLTTYDSAADEWDAEQVLRLVDRIPAPCGPTLKAILLGSSYEELSIREGVSNTAVRTRVHRAQVQLASLMNF